MALCFGTVIVMDEGKKDNDEGLKSLDLPFKFSPDRERETVRRFYLSGKEK